MFTTSHAVCPDNAFQDETPQDETPHRGAIALFCLPSSARFPTHVSYREILSFQPGNAAPYRISGEHFVATKPPGRSRTTGWMSDPMMDFHHEWLCQTPFCPLSPAGCRITLTAASHALKR
jgi:hypothetical protein